VTPGKSSAWSRMAIGCLLGLTSSAATRSGWSACGLAQPWHASRHSRSRWQQAERPAFEPFARQGRPPLGVLAIEDAPDQHRRLRHGSLAEYEAPRMRPFISNTSEHKREVLEAVTIAASTHEP